MRSAFLCAALAVLTASTAHAEIESESVRAGVAAYDALEFARSIDLLEKALGESLTREERVIAYRTIAFANCALERADDARAAFTRLLRIDPGAELDKSVAPRVRALFEEARAQVATGRAEPATSAALPALELEVRPAQPKEGTTLSIVAVAPGGLGKQVALYHRIRGEPHYSEVKGPGRDGRFELTVPGGEVRASALEYYAVALDEHGVAIARAGNVNEPLVLAVAGTPQKKPRKRAWIWGVVGGVVVAGVVLGAVLGTTLSSPDPKSPADVMLIAPR